MKPKRGKINGSKMRRRGKSRLRETPNERRKNVKSRLKESVNSRLKSWKGRKERQLRNESANYVRRSATKSVRSRNSRD